MYTSIDLSMGSVQKIQDAAHGECERYVFERPSLCPWPWRAMAGPAGLRDAGMPVATALISG